MNTVNVESSSEEVELLQCPFEKSHLILPTRFAVHLVRCRKSHPKAGMVTCPFDNTHRVNAADLEKHVTNCTARRGYELFKNTDSTIAGLSTTISLYDESLLATSDTTMLDTFNSDENWEQDPVVPAYNPQKYVENSSILRHPVGLTPSQRRAFRQAENKRLLELENGRRDMKNVNKKGK